MLQALGFRALATTSAGFAWSLGRLDGRVTREEKLAHCRAIVEAVDLPVSADLENGFGREPEVVAETIRLAAETGLAGGSIEDFSGDPANPIYDVSLALDRIHAAVEAARALPAPFVLTARCENLLHGRMNLDDTIHRLQAFESAGADVLYAPGLATVEEVRQVTGALSTPVNVLGPMVTGATVGELIDAGAKRISLGGALARAALGGLLDAATAVRDTGRFDGFGDAASRARVAELLRRWA
jgi:2-methylisocitrate lyase-like PEP mutase family enzyme